MKKKKRKTTYPPDMPIKQALPVIIFILILAASLRITSLWQCSLNYDFFFIPQPGTDMYTYHNQALGILKGTFPQKPFYYNPLYPYFLAMIYMATSKNIIAVYTCQLVLGLITCILVYLISARVFNHIVGIIAMLLTALSFDLILYTGILLSATLDTFLCVLSIFLLIKLKYTYNYVLYIIAGIVLGLGVLSRPNTGLFVIPAIVWLAWNIKDKKKWLLTYSLLLCGIIFPISLCTIKNYQTSGGKFILVSTNGPENLWIGNNEHATGWFHRPHEIQEIKKRVPQEGEKIWIQDVLRFIHNDPIAYAKLLFKKFRLFWSNYSIDSNNLFYSRFKTYSTLLCQPYILNIGIIFPLGLIGMLLCLRKNKNISLLYIFVIAYSFSVIIIFILDRLRLPVIPIMAIFGAWCIYWFYKQIVKTKAYKIASYMSILLFILMICVNFHILTKDIYPYIFPKGIYKETRTYITIHDDTNLWDGLTTETLTSGGIIQKDIFIDRDVGTGIKAVYICLEFASIGNGELLLKINDIPFGHGKCSDTGGFLTASRIHIPNSLLKKGLNSIQVKVSSGLILTIPVDTFYCFKRSRISKDNGLTWKTINGEYRIWIEMEKDIPQLS